VVEVSEERQSASSSAGESCDRAQAAATALAAAAETECGLPQRQHLRREEGGTEWQPPFSGATLAAIFQNNEWLQTIVHRMRILRTSTGVRISSRKKRLEPQYVETILCCTSASANRWQAPTCRNITENHHKRVMHNNEPLRTTHSFTQKHKKSP
jgi:hypothetical protein